MATNVILARSLTVVLVTLACTRWPLPASAAVLDKLNTTLTNGTSTAIKMPEIDVSLSDEEELLESCTCGVFMSGQLQRARSRGRRARLAPRGAPVLTYDTEDVCLPCGAAGYKRCVNKCLDEMIKHLSKAGPLVCSALERDCTRERAHLFMRNCDAQWVGTSFSAGKEFCCRAGAPVDCAAL